MRPACRRQGKPHVRFDEGGVGRNAWHAATEPQRGNPVTDVCRSLNAVTYSSTLPFGDNSPGEAAYGFFNPCIDGAIDEGEYGHRYHFLFFVSGFGMTKPDLVHRMTGGLMTWRVAYDLSNPLFIPLMIVFIIHAFTGVRRAMLCKTTKSRRGTAWVAGGLGSFVLAYLLFLAQKQTPPVQAVSGFSPWFGSR